MSKPSTSQKLSAFLAKPGMKEKAKDELIEILRTENAWLREENESLRQQEVNTFVACVICVLITGAAIFIMAA